LSCWSWPVANFLVNAGIAIGTLILASFAVYVEILKHPNLSIEFKQEEPFYRARDLRIVNMPQTHYWISVKVKNKGKKAAENCLGKLKEILEIENGKTKPFQPFDPVILHWIGEGCSPITINKDDEEWLGVVHTSKNDQSAKVFCKERSEDEPEIKTNLKVGEYLLKITIVGSNVKPATKKYRLIWKGTWNEIKMEKISSFYLFLQRFKHHLLL